MGLELADNVVTSVVTDLAGWVLAKASTPVAVSRRRPGWVEANPHDWLAAAILTIRRTVHDAGVQPLAIGLTGQQHGLVLVDDAGVPVRPAILLPDTEALRRSPPYTELPRRVRRSLVNPIDPARAGPLLAWIRTHEPGSYARTRRVVQPKDWLRAQLTGEFHTEPSDASTTLLYDFFTEAWSVNAVEQLGLDPDVLPAILPSGGHQAGLLTTSAADMIGLRPGTPAAAGAGRTAATALGSGLADGHSAQIILGTHPQVIAPVPALPERLPLPGVAHLARAATDRGWLLTVTATGCGNPTAISATSSLGVDDAPTARRLNSTRQLALDIAAAVRAVAALAPVTRLQISGDDTAHPGLLDFLADLVDEPLFMADPLHPAARAAALLGARAASLMNEETLMATLVPRRSHRFPHGSSGRHDVPYASPGSNTLNYLVRSKEVTR